MKFTMTVDMDNAAFDETGELDRICRGELTRILRDVARRPQDGQNEGIVMDINGNKIGSWEVTA